MLHFSCITARGRYGVVLFEYRIFVFDAFIGTKLSEINEQTMERFKKTSLQFQIITPGTNWKTIIFQLWWFDNRTQQKCLHIRHASTPSIQNGWFGFFVYLFFEWKDKIGLQGVSIRYWHFFKKSYMDRRTRERNLPERNAQLGRNLFLIGLFCHLKAEFNLKLQCDWSSWHIALQTVAWLVAWVGINAKSVFFQWTQMEWRLKVAC